MDDMGSQRPIFAILYQTSFVQLIMPNGPVSARINEYSSLTLVIMFGRVLHLFSSRI
jgi:hypothetical protein